MKTISNFLIFILMILCFGCLSNDTEEYLNDLKSENVMVRNNAIYYLGEKKETRAVPTLLEFLKNGTRKEIKLKAIEALGKIGRISFIDELIGILIDIDMEMRNAALEALVNVLKDTDTEIRIAAVEALGKIEDSKAVKPLVNILPHKDIQLFVIRALGDIGDKSVVPVLTKLLDDPDKYVSYNAAQALKKIGNSE